LGHHNNNSHKKYHETLLEYENWDQHYSLIKSYFPDDQQVEKALTIIKKHHDQPRYHFQGNYINHPVRVARILLEEFNIKDKTTILIALLHDLIEWSDYDISKIKKEFGEEIDMGVKTLTWDQKGEWVDFVDRIINSGHKNLIKIKIADKLDNNRGVLMTDNIDEIRKARQKTIDIMQPVIKKYYPAVWPKFTEVLNKLETKCLVIIFNSIRDIPYRIPLSLNEPDQCCTGKCQLLKQKLTQAGYQVRYRVCTFSWNSLDLPPSILNIPNRDLATHVYLEILLKHIWVTLDPSWDAGLKDIFPINEWDGFSNTELAVPLTQIFYPAKSAEIMRRYNDQAILKDLKINRQFYQAFNEYLEKERKNNK